MSVSTRFLRFASICAFATALTTLAIHLLPELWADADTFEEQLQLRHNSSYVLHSWVTVVHCLLVVVSMFGLGVLRLSVAPVLIRFGFLGFLFFAFIEILRTSLRIFALNRTWRANYEAATDDAARMSLRATIGAFSGINESLFFLFLTAFIIGLLCYGFAFVGAKGLEQKVGLLLLLWAALSIPGYVDTVRGTEVLSAYFEWVGSYFQPIARALLGVWLWTASNRPASPNPG
ncbi:MAG: hypothetical protein ND895_09410 [Pyrinomonadaceae bacterium]|nr:hypothetical protein [Pyrinomonadaceae bacterium]